MQPYIFPYIGYFQLINYVDKWVVFDDTQYISKGWVNRNRILHPEVKKEWQYFTVPVKKHVRESKIKDIKINNNIEWREQFLGKLTSYKKKAPNYAITRDFVSNCISYECSSLSEWLVYTLENTCDYLDIDFDHTVFSQMDVDIKSVQHAGQWALKIADMMGADEYINPHGGYDIFNNDEFEDRDIQLYFLKPEIKPYVQRRGCFVPGLSIIDVMMWNDKDDIREMLEDFNIYDQQRLRASEHER